MTNDEHQELALSLEYSVWRAVVEKDGVKLGDLFAEDYIEVTLNGQRVQKKAVVSESPQVDEIAGYTTDSELVVSVNDGCLLLSYHLTIHGTSRGVVISPPDRWATSIWSRHADSWKCHIFQQSTFGPDQPQST